MSAGIDAINVVAEGKVLPALGLDAELGEDGGGRGGRGGKAAASGGQAASRDRKHEQTGTLTCGKPSDKCGNKRKRECNAAAGAGMASGGACSRREIGAGRAGHGES